MSPSVSAPQDEILRGWEIVRWREFSKSWEPVSKWRPTELAARQAATDLKWLRERNQTVKYEMRALVSVGQSVSVKEPLVLDADEEG